MRRLMFALLMLVGAWMAPQSASALGCVVLGCDCSVTATDIQFASFDPLQGGVQTAVGEIDVSCTGVVSIGGGVEVELDDGTWGSFTSRKMRSSAGDLIDYNIYTSGAHSVVWGDGSSGNQSVYLSGGLIVLLGWSASHDMHAALTAAPSMKPGSYSDTVVVRVIW